MTLYLYVPENGHAVFSPVLVRPTNYDTRVFSMNDDGVTELDGTWKPCPYIVDNKKLQNELATDL